MTTKTEIVNLALHRLGTERVSNLTANNKRTKVMNDIYETVLKKTLRHHSWNFALKRVQLSQLTTKPAFGYEFEYSLPADYLKIWEIADSSDIIRNPHPGCEGFIRTKVEYVIEDGKLLTDLEEVYVLYGYNNIDTSLYSDTFIDALSLGLAAKACYSITQDSNLNQLLNAELEKYLSESRSDSSQEYSAPDAYVVEDFTAIRGS